jgi:hypothetical protein
MRWWWNDERWRRRGGGGEEAGRKRQTDSSFVQLMLHQLSLTRVNKAKFGSIKSIRRLPLNVSKNCFL